MRLSTLSAMNEDALFGYRAVRLQVIMARLRLYVFNLSGPFVSVVGWKGSSANLTAWSGSTRVTCIVMTYTMLVQLMTLEMNNADCN